MDLRGRDRGARLRRRPRALSRHRPRAARRRPRGDARPSTTSSRGSRRRCRARAGRVDPRPGLARGEVDGPRARGRARLPHPRGALGGLARRTPSSSSARTDTPCSVNAKAMALFGITRATRAPEGGEIIHDAAGEPTGVFVDNAERLVTPPERSRAGAAARARARDGRVPREGRHQPDRRRRAGRGDRRSTRSSAAAGKLRTRLYVMASGLATMQALGRPESGLGGGLLDVRAVKLYADGALGSRGAALLEPYADDPGNLGPRPDPARGDAGGRALRARPRLPGRASTRSATGPTASCSTSTRRPSPRGPR